MSALNAIFLGLAVVGPEKRGSPFPLGHLAPFQQVHYASRQGRKRWKLVERWPLYSEDNWGRVSQKHPHKGNESRQQLSLYIPHKEFPHQEERTPWVAPRDLFRGTGEFPEGKGVAPWALRSPKGEWCFVSFFSIFDLKPIDLTLV